MTTKVKKSNIRAFLILCAKVAGTEKDEDKRLLFLTALKNGVIQRKIESGGRWLKTEEIAEFYSINCKELVEVTNKLAQLLNDKESFDIIIDGKKEIIHIWQDKESTFVEEIKFQMRPDQATKDTPEKNDFGPIYSDLDLIPVFFASLRQYKEKRGITWSQMPLRICDWCCKPFFGSRNDQRFCCKNHGQRWHAKKSYAKSKKS